MSTTKTSDLHITRTFDAPRELVFAAWSDEDQVAQWFGPRQWPVSSWKHDFVAGGRFEYVMQGPDGIEAPGSGEYVEIDAPSKIVGRSRIMKGDDLFFETLQTYRFADNGDGTTTFTVDVEIVFDDNFPGRAGMEQGWSETLDRLGEFLATVS
jgi:uncharacterized protein YndB with AHSA1/START domain